MSLGLIGRKIGMTRIFTENGDSLPVTVIDVSNNRVTQIKKSTFGAKHQLKILVPSWLGEWMDYSIAVEGLLQRE